MNDPATSDVTAAPIVPKVVAEQPTVTVVDYGTGNFGSVANMLRRVGAHTEVARTDAEIRAATRIVLPGVGAFNTAMRALNEAGLATTLADVAGGPAPILGVCLGMQLLLDGSDEGTLPGLGLIPGRARRLDVETDTPPERIPHVGWSELTLNREDPLLAEIEEPRFYFTHSYRALCSDPRHVVASATYGCEIAGVIRHGNVWGAQFHPEKSGRNGMQLFRNFLEF